jgi:hypothetical protein
MDMTFTEANSVEALVRDVLAGPCDLPPGPLPDGRGSRVPLPFREGVRG